MGVSSTALLVVQVNCARPAVFEQMDNGTVVPMADGMTPEMPSANSDASLRKPVAQRPISGVLPAVLTGKKAEQSVPVRPTGTIVADAPSESVDQPAATQSRITFAGPLASSSDHADMRFLTAEVGLAYAHAPAVIRARLDERSFVDLFTAMIRKESGFDAHAVSPAGAGGLGQLMPETARELGVSDVFSPRDNLDGSARYLTAMLDEFGSPALALAAYNAGPGAVRQYGGIPPFAETHAYVADILEAFSHGSGAYEQLLAAQRNGGENHRGGSANESACGPVSDNTC